MPGVQPPRWDLDPAVLSYGEGVQLFLEYPDSIPPFLDVEVREQVIPRARGTQATGKWSGAPLS